VSEAAGERPGADVVVVAAGASRRMVGTDKLMAPIGGRPLLAWTLDAVAASPVVERLVLVTAPARVDEVASAAWLPPRVDAVVAGGATRQVSVAAGVRWIAEHDPGRPARPVLVHDGARPLVSPALVTAIAEAAAAHGAAIPVLPVAETLKRVGPDGRITGTVDRASLGAAQTPQGIRRDLLLRAWTAFPPEGPPEFTDEAALLEACRIAVHAIPGEPSNLKVTLPDDLRRAEQALAPEAVRVGFGHDSHPFGPGSPLRLGGVEIPGAPRLAGHSDGDVILHAVADALLGAASMGDLGRLFPADARTPRDVASAALLQAVVERLGGAGLAPASVDVVVIGARPRLGGRLDEMRSAIAAILGIEPGDVSVKASSGNLAGDEGAGRSISARAVVTVRRRP
jgi:2-C-methyl-D-erythritol 4-phosphate cytidylyltransferase/2-C-methyl-D-erythritol 2,4-cyclodiphosphate synthase